mgnify:CR=1 FL=1
MDTLHGTRFPGCCMVRGSACKRTCIASLMARIFPKTTEKCLCTLGLVLVNPLTRIILVTSPTQCVNCSILTASHLVTSPTRCVNCSILTACGCVHLSELQLCKPAVCRHGYCAHDTCRLPRWCPRWALWGPVGACIGVSVCAGDSMCCGLVMTAT